MLTYIVIMLILNKQKQSTILQQLWPKVTRTSLQIYYIDKHTKLSFLEFKENQIRKMLFLNVCLQLKCSCF